MRALTICQPWAHAIAWLGKPVENRSWGTRYRGPLLIHAGAARHMLTGSVCHEIGLLAEVSAPLVGMRQKANEWPADPLLAARVCAFSAVVAVAEVVDCVHVSEGWNSRTVAAWREKGIGGWFCGPYGIALANVRPLTRPVAASGSQGLWVPSDELVARVMDEVEGKVESSKLKVQSEKVEHPRGLFAAQGRML